MADTKEVAALEKTWLEACAAKRALFEKGVKKDSAEYRDALAKVNAAWVALQTARGVDKTKKPAAAAT